MTYDPGIPEEELKNRVARDVFGAFDCARIFGKVDFCVSPHVEGPTLWETESLLWAEAKKGVRADFAPLFAQLVLTVGGERTFEKHIPPPFLGAFDCEKIAFLPWHAALDLFFRSDVDWTATPSKTDSPAFQHVLSLLRPILAEHLVSFAFGDPDLPKFVRKNLFVGNDRTNRLQVTRNNFPFVYQKWVKAVKPSIAVNWEGARRQGIHDADFFLADLLSKDNATLMEKLFVVLRGDHYNLDRKLDAAGFIDAKRAEFSDGQKAHAQFWNQYRRPPRRAFWDFINERRDLLMPADIRERQGSFFTPQIWVEKAQEAIAAVLGEDWQDDHYVWDCAAGTGNLLAGLDPKAKYRVWASTLQQADVDIMRERIRNGAALLESHVFRFDFLNDSFDALPDGLREIVSDPEKRRKLVVFINPPYAEAGDIRQRSGTGKNKTDVAVSHSYYERCVKRIGLAGRELFAQFLVRIHDELSGCVIGQFSKLKHLSGPNFKAFRQIFRCHLEKSFIVPGNTFDNVRGEFPIGFFVWRNEDGEVFSETQADVFNDKSDYVGKKTILSYDEVPSINDWLIETRKRRSSVKIGFLSCRSHDVQHINDIYIKNDKVLVKSARGSWITDSNLIEACVYLAVCHSIEADWLNDRDQFLWPKDTWKTDREFQLDCLVFTLFHGQNRISCKAGNLNAEPQSRGERKDGSLCGSAPLREEKIVPNHWIPFTEDEVGAKDCFKSHFMSDFLKAATGAGRAGLASEGTGGTQGTKAGQGTQGIFSALESAFPSQGMLFAAEGDSIYGGDGGASRPGEPPQPAAPP